MALIAAHLNAGVILVVTEYIYQVYNLPLPPPPYPLPPFYPSLISRTVSVDVKHHVYFAFMFASASDVPHHTVGRWTLIRKSGGVQSTWEPLLRMHCYSRNVFGAVGTIITLQYNFLQYNFITKCQYNCTGMFCGAKYTHYTFTPIIKKIIKLQQQQTNIQVKSHPLRL